MNPNQYKKDKEDSPQQSGSNSGAQDILIDDTPKQKKVKANQVNPQQSGQNKKSAGKVIFMSNDSQSAYAGNKRKSQSQKNSSMSSNNRPAIYDEVQRNQDNQGYQGQRNQRHGYPSRYDRPRDYNRRNQQAGHNGPNRFNRQQYESGRNRDTNGRHNYNRNTDQGYHQHHQSRNNRYQQHQNYEYQPNDNYQWTQNQRQSREQFNFQTQTKNFHQNPTNKHNYHRQNYNNHRNYHQNDKNFNQQHHNQAQRKQNNQYPRNYPVQPYQRQQHNRRLKDNNYQKRSQIDEQSTNPNQYRKNHQFETQNTRNHHFDTENPRKSRSKPKNQFKTNQKVNQRLNQPQIQQQKQLNKQPPYQQKDYKKYPQPSKEDQPILNDKKSSNQRKQQQPPKILSQKESFKSAQSHQNKSTTLNQAHSHITVQNSANLQPQNKKLDQSSVWQNSSEEEEKEEDQSKSLEKSSFQCHQISIEYPSLPPVVNRNDQNISSFVEDFSLLQALDNQNQDKEQDSPRNLEINRQILEPIHKKEEKHSAQIQQQQQKQSDSIFTSSELKMMQKMFQSIPLQSQCVFVQIRIKTQNVSQYKIKELSSELYHVEGTTPQNLKGHKFISIKQFEKSVPRDAQPHGRNRQVNQKIELKTSKIVLAQVKNPIHILNHHEDLFGKFDSPQEQQVIKKIEKHKKFISKAETMINIEEVTLKCSTCNGKKSFLWNGQIISHQCKAQCANFLRFNIDSITIC